MYPTAARLSKASRRPLTTKRGNKDYYKGTRQAFLPGGHRTGAPGKHVIGGKAKYRLLDEKVRVFVAPPIEAITSSAMKPYVHTSVHLTKSQQSASYGKFKTAGGLTSEHYYKLLRADAAEANKTTKEVVGADSKSPATPTASTLHRAMETLGLR